MQQKGVEQPRQLRSAAAERRDQVPRGALEWPTYGSRRITAELRRGDVPVTRKRAPAADAEDKLLGLRKRVHST
jgi:hypothetical protein